MKHLSNAKLYKVVSPTNESMHGGSYKWELNVPSPELKNPRICSHGYHLTTKPQIWANKQCRIYKAIGTNLGDIDDDKRCFESVTLIEELEAPYIFRLDNLVGHNRYSLSEARFIIMLEYGDVLDKIPPELAFKYLREFTFCREVRTFLQNAMNRKR